MTDLISREDAYRVLTEYYHQRTDFQHEALKDALGKVPTIQPKRGEWIWDDDVCKCSECLKEAVISDEMEVQSSDFCPNCGADMRGE